MDARGKINLIKEHYNFKTDKELAEFLDKKTTTLSSWITRNALDYEVIYAKCIDIDANWLLSGEGEMLRNNSAIGEYSNDNILMVKEDQSKYTNHSIQDLQKTIDMQDLLISSLKDTIKAKEDSIQALKETITTMKENRR